MSNYDEKFFDYINAGAERSAQCVVPLLLAVLKIESVLDVGCGQGAWLSLWKKLGVKHVTGIDGSYVDRNGLLISPKEFIAHNLTEGFDLQRHYDLVVSMEVAEHLSSGGNESFVNSLVAHGDLILFSAAPRGQGGHNHVNEQDYELLAKIVWQA
jgi:2-polyprenyl-3-methyl-5-hydroxy-6-metoxy-1,4-benzoquinol methylase